MLSRSKSEDNVAYRGSQAKLVAKIVIDIDAGFAKDVRYSSVNPPTEIFHDEWNRDSPIGVRTVVFGISGT